MKFYSEVTNKLYETEEELHKAEDNHRTKQAELELRRAKEELERKKEEEGRKLEKEKYLKAIKDAESEYLKVKQDYDNLIEAYHKKCTELSNVYYDAVKAYNKKYGTYFETIPDEDVDKYFDNYFKIFSNLF